jgi:hypothetical protein
MLRCIIRVSMNLCRSIVKSGAQFSVVTANSSREGAFSCLKCVHVSRNVHRSSSPKDAMVILLDGLRYSKKRENSSLGCE